MTQRQQIDNGVGRIVTVTGASDGINNDIANGSIGGGKTSAGNAIGTGVSVAAYQNANTMQAAPAWAFQLLPSLYNHYQKVLETPHPALPLPFSPSEQWQQYFAPFYLSRSILLFFFFSFALPLIVLSTRVVCLFHTPR